MSVVVTLAIEFENEAQVIAFCETLKSDKRRVHAAEIRLTAICALPPAGVDV
jgi:hypothetical protein